MSEEEEHMSPGQKEFTNRFMEDMSLDQQLLSAAQRGQGSLIKELLMQGAQLTVDQNGATAIHQAAQGGFADVVRILLEHGTDIDIPDSGGYTALHKAAGKGHLDVLGLLINEGCDIDTQDDTYGNTPLHEAAWNGFSKSVDLLLKNKSNAFISNRAGCTSLHLAAQSGHNQSGRALLYAGCSPDVKNNYGDTPLHTAARYGHAGIARILISARCSISEQNKNGDTSLHIAAAFKRRKIAKLLVEGGIITQLANKQGETATEIARRKDHMSIIEIIHHGQAEPTGGVRLNYSTDHSRTTVSSQPTNDSREATPENNNRERKKSTGLVSWIKKKFAKEKIEKEELGRSGLTSSKALDLDDGNLGLFSQYVKRQGFAYYRDLAGNVRQGPVGYVPNCHCEASKPPPRIDPNLGGKPAAYHDHMASTSKILNQRLRDIELQANKKKMIQDKIHEVDLATQERLLAERQDCLERLRRHSAHERQTLSRQIEQADTNLRGDLHSWLATQVTEGKDSDPFGYAVGTKQQRFGDDFDHERIARYEAMNSEHFPPPPRLFRSRSDETLTHSEYSFHGRAFKSREAAMEELKTLKHHEEIRERRKLIRAGVNTESKSRQLGRSQSQSSNAQHEKQYTSAGLNASRDAGLWMSRDHLDDANSRTDTAGESHDTPNNDYATTARRENTNHISSITTHQGESILRTNDTPRVAQGRVLGRRESSGSPERRPQAKASISMPLKSAMRQPRPEKTSDDKQSRIYRSNSLPRDSKVEFNGFPTRSSEPKKPVKTVRYDETVKSAEIAQDLPPSLSPVTAEEILLPAKREAPIGGHDEKYSEGTRPPAPSYHSIAAAMNRTQTETASNDLRDSIMNARKELLARNKPDTVKVLDERMRKNVIPQFENPNRINPNGTYAPKPTNHSTGDQRSFYGSQDMVKRPPQPQAAIPFSQYSTGNTHYNRQINNPDSASRANQPHSTSSLPRPQRNPSRNNLPNGAGAPRRFPLPSYEEIQSNRMVNGAAHQPSNHIRMPPNYSINKQPNQTPNPHRPSNNDPLPRPRNGINTHLHQKTFHNPPLTESTSINNTGSCSSSNPDSGYSGNFYDSKTMTSPADYNSWYQQNIQTTALKMTAQQALNASRPNSGQYPVQSPNHLYNTRPARPAPLLSVPRRTVYTNMTSDV